MHFYLPAEIFLIFRKLKVNQGKQWIMNLQKTASLLIICIAIVAILIYGQTIIVPFTLGVLLWFIGKAVESSLDRIPFVRNKFPKWLKRILSIVVIIMVLGFVANILTSNINLLAKSLDKYQPNIDLIIGQLDDLLKMDVRAKLQDYSGGFDFTSLLRLLFTSISDILSNTFMILIYAVFIFLEEASFKPKLQAIFLEEEQRGRVDNLFNQIGDSISSYFKLKTIVSLITGSLSYLALLIIGVDAPEFWAFIIFILNFIPTIGSLIATVFPAVFCLLQFGAFSPFILVLVIVGLIQVFVGNFLEPKLMGSSMNISPLVTILSLSIWGAIWGIIGMILSVPIAVITIIILSQFEKTRPIAIMLSEKGKVAS